MTIKDLWYWFKHWLLGDLYLVLVWDDGHKTYHRITTDDEGNLPPVFYVGGEWRPIEEGLEPPHYHNIIGLNYDPH